jgi:hypothetical protein
LFYSFPQATRQLIVTIPASMLKEFMEGFYRFENNGPKFRSWALNMQPDFPQPGFYQAYFKEWGLDAPKK